MVWVEIVGWIGAGFVLVGFLMKPVKWIRLLNMIGCVVNVVYGILTHTWATMALSLAVFFTHLVFFVNLAIKNKKNKIVKDEKTAE